MRKMSIPISFLLCLLILMVGCSDSTGPEPKPLVYGEIQYYGATYLFNHVDCYVSATDGGEPMYSLSVRFTDDERRSIRFNVQDAQNDPANLITVGEHPATGQHWDGAGCYMQPASFYINYLSGAELSVVWNEIELQDNIFSGNGYIHLKERIELACADSIWVGGYFARPGDPEYDRYYEAYCEPGYYFPAQKVWFECEEGCYSGAK